MILNETIYNFTVNTQCCLGEKGVDVIDKLSLDNLCQEDKYTFILAHIFNQLIRAYNPEISTAKYEFTMQLGIHHFQIDSITIGTYTYNVNLDVYTTAEDLCMAIVEILNLQDGLQVFLTSRSDVNNYYLTFNFLTDKEEFFGESVPCSFDGLYKDGVLSNINVTIDFLTPNPYYNCITEEQFCNMVTFLKRYCKNQTICSTCKSI